MDLPNADVAQIAGMLISYHMNAFRIRRHEIFDVEVAPAMVEELKNLQMWLGDELDAGQRYVRGVALREVVTDCKSKLNQLSQEASGAEDPGAQYEEAQVIMAQLRSADYLMELL